MRFNKSILGWWLAFGGVELFFLFSFLVVFH